MSTVNNYFEYALGAVDSSHNALPSNEALYGPYASVSAAHTAVKSAFDDDESAIPIGLTVGIKVGYTITEYWYNGGTAQTNLVKKAVTDTSSCAPKESPEFTGTPKAPTAEEKNNSTQIATTAYVDRAAQSVEDDLSDIVDGTTTVGKATADGNGNKITDTYAPKESPEFTGTPKAPTADEKNNSTQIATTAYVDRAAQSVEDDLSDIVDGTTTVGKADEATRDSAGDNIASKFAEIASQISALTALEGSNFLGIHSSLDDTDLTVGLSKLSEGEEAWILYGSDLSKLQLYVYDVEDTQWMAFDESKTYDFTDFAELKEEVASFHEWKTNPEYKTLELDVDGRILSAIDDNNNRHDYLNEVKHGNVEVKGTFTNPAVTGHLNSKANPHNVTKGQLGLGNISDDGDDVTVKGRVKSSAADHTIAVAKDIYDEDQEEYQSDINARTVVTENNEFIYLKLDQEGRIVYGIKADGTIYYGNGVPPQVIAAIKNEVITFKTDITNILEHLEDIETRIAQNTYSEFASVTIDAEGKIVEAIYRDGTKYIAQLKSPTLDSKIDKSDEASLIPNELLEMVELFDSGEYAKVTLDFEGKVIDYMKPDGEVVHNNLHTFSNLKVNDSFSMGEGATSDLVKVLKDYGFSTGATDWSDYITDNKKKPLCLPTPRCAILNIISDYTLSSLSKAGRSNAVAGTNYELPTKVQFWDMNGNYFSKWTLMSAQGNSSMSFIKKNLAFDFFDSEVDGDAFAIKFGDWVAQDSFHFKAFYTDFFRANSMVAYQLADEVALSRGIKADRPWKKALIDWDNVTSEQSSVQMNDMNLQIDNGARCMPDGFPCIVYQKGEFYGIYSMSLKKDRDNYNMNKKTPEHIHLDGTLNWDTFFGGTIDWTQFEIRNPKNLYCMDGSKYDGDNPKELSDEDAFSKKVKGYIQALASTMSSIRSTMASDVDSAKTILNERFDLDNLIDYQLVQMATGDSDGFGKNWQWITYDGAKWYCCNYDKDMAFGGYFTGAYTQKVLPSAGGWMDSSGYTPTSIITDWYQAELKARWQELVALGIFTTNHIIDLFKAYIARIGKNNYELEWTKWTECPANRDKGTDITNWDVQEEYAREWSSTKTYKADEVIYYISGSVKRAYKSLQASNLNHNPATETDYWEDVTWNASIEYAVGDICYYGKSFLYKSVAKVANTNMPPFTKFYTYYPQEFGYRDSFWRLVSYIEQRITKNNEFINKL